MASIPGRRATLVDVAALAGVSRSTASRVLSGVGAVSPATELRVRTAASQVGYRVNGAARTLRTSRTMLTGLVLNNLFNATFQVVVEIVQRRLAEHGYRTVLCVTGGDHEQEAGYLDTLAEQGVDGIVIIGSGTNSDRLGKMSADGIAIVNLIRAGKSAPGDKVLAADTEGAVLATKHLLNLGHRRIGYVGGPMESNSGLERFEGYAATVRAAGTYADELIVRGPFTSDFGATAVRELLALEEPPTAIYLANHEAALAGLPTLRDLGVAVPQELSVVAHEEASWFRYWDPAITFVDNGASELAEVAVGRLLRAMKGGRDTGNGREFRVGAALVTRSSTAAPAPAARGI